MRKFKKIYIEITNVCNLSCSFCPQTGRTPEFMSIEAFERILDEIKPYGEYIYFHVKGEPLLHPYIDKLLDISFEKGFKVNITTNGTLINRVGNRIMSKDALRQINFSLHSFDGNEGGVNKEEYIRDIILFTKEAVEKTNLIVAYRLWNLNKSNEINQKNKRNNRILEIIESEFNLTYKILEEITPDRGIKISDRVFLNQDHEFEWPDLEKEEDNSSGFCYGLRNQIGILVDGTVVPCCLDGEGVINLGNINRVPFSKIVDGERAKNIFEGFSRREAVEELCRKCGYRKKFND